MRSISSSRSSSSAWAFMETYSPAAIETAPPMRPTRPARRTSDGAGLAPAKPRTMAMLDTSPSLTPNTAARAAPPWTLRWCFSGSCGLGRGPAAAPAAATVVGGLRSPSRRGAPRSPHEGTARGPADRYPTG